METPITRKELYLAAAAGESVDLPEPITREEHYLKAIAEGGGGGGGDSYTKAETDLLLADKQDTYTADNTAWDATPTANSTKPVTSGGVYTANGGCVTVYCTQAEYDLLNPPDENTEYNILEVTPTPTPSVQQLPGESRGVTEEQREEPPEEERDEPEDGDMR